MKLPVTIGICIFVLFSHTSLVCCGELPVEMLLDDGRYVVVNTGSCPIYKLYVNTIPPKKEGAVNFLTRLGAAYVNIASFSADLGMIKKGGRISFKLSDLTDSSGKRLDEGHQVGALKFEGSTCGESGLSVMFAGPSDVSNSAECKSKCRQSIKNCNMYCFDCDLQDCEDKYVECRKNCK
jgi:hypothetical protein